MGESSNSASNNQSAPPTPQFNQMGMRPPMPGFGPPNMGPSGFGGPNMGGFGGPHFGGPNFGGPNMGE